MIRQRIETSGRVAYYFRDVEWDYAVGVLTISGRVPTAGLKRVLWRLIGELDGIEEVADCVDIVSSSGLSSVCSKPDGARPPRHENGAAR